MTEQQRLSISLPTEGDIVDSPFAAANIFLCFGSMCSESAIHMGGIALCMCVLVSEP